MAARKQSEPINYGRLAGLVAVAVIVTFTLAYAHANMVQRVGMMMEAPQTEEAKK